MKSMCGLPAGGTRLHTPGLVGETASTSSEMHSNGFASSNVACLSLGFAAFAVAIHRVWSGRPAFPCARCSLNRSDRRLRDDVCATGRYKRSIRLRPRWPRQRRRQWISIEPQAHGSRCRWLWGRGVPAPVPRLGASTVQQVGRGLLRVEWPCVCSCFHAWGARMEHRPAGIAPGRVCHGWRGATRPHGLCAPTPSRAVCAHIQPPGCAHGTPQECRPSCGSWPKVARAGGGQAPALLASGAMLNARGASFLGRPFAGTPLRRPWGDLADVVAPGGGLQQPNQLADLRA